MVQVAWTAVTHAETYDVVMERDAGGSWEAYATWSVLGSPLPVWPQHSPATYQVRVRASGAAGDGSWSSWVAFDFEAPGPPVVEEPPEPDESVPGNLWPASITLTSGSVTLSWSAVPGAGSYDVDIDWYEAGGWSSYCDYSVQTPSKTFWPQLDPGAYRWRVRVVGQTWSSWASFDYDTSASVTGGDTPTELWPAGGITVTTESVTLSWLPVGGAAAYQAHIQWRKDGVWTDYYTYDTNGTSKTFWPQVDPASYRWRVRANLDATWTTWTEWAEFEFDA